MTLPTRRIGPFTVSSISLGCMNLSHAYGVPPSAEDGARLLNHALDLGITLLDTAALYGGGRNEALLASAVGRRRRDYVLASKCVLGLVEGKRVLDGSPAAITRSIDASLQRLGTDHIDLMYLHRPDHDVPIEDSVGALVLAKKAGKIGAIGCSEMDAATIRRAHAVHPVAAVQTEYSPAVRNPEIAVLDTCRELDIGFVAFSSLARGLLAGSLHNDAYAPGDIRAAMPRFVGSALQQNLKVVAEFAGIAGAVGVTPAQLSLAWTLSRAPHVVAIPGTTSIAHLEENLASASIELPVDVIARIDALFVPGVIRGPRYPAPQQAQVLTETFPDEDLA